MSWEQLLGFVPMLNILLLPMLGGIIKVNNSITRMATEIEHQKELRKELAGRIDKIEQRFNSQRCNA